MLLFSGCLPRAKGILHAKSLAVLDNTKRLNVVPELYFHMSDSSVDDNRIYNLIKLVA